MPDIRRLKLAEQSLGQVLIRIRPPPGSDNILAPFLRAQRHQNPIRNGLGRMFKLRVKALVICPLSRNPASTKTAGISVFRRTISPGRSMVPRSFQPIRPSSVFILKPGAPLRHPGKKIALSVPEAVPELAWHSGERKRNNPCVPVICHLCLEADSDIHPALSYNLHQLRFC